MKVKIVYKSKKNTKKVAEAIGSATGIKPQELSSVGSLDNVDVLFLGCGIYGGNVPPEVDQFVDRLHKGQVKKVVLFTTCGFGKDQTETLKSKIRGKGIAVSDQTFVGLGRAFFKNRKEPNESTLEQAKRFAKQFV